MHLFLTGEIQIGKTTVITRILELLQITPGGFTTYFGPDRSLPDKLLYMNSASKPKVFSPKCAIARLFADKPPEVFTERFSSYGVGLLQAGRNSARLILMDECGSLERDAVAFQEEILDILDGNIPVLGVVKLASKGWTDRIRNHPKVELITVTEKNRDTLPPLLASRLASEMEKVMR